MDWNIWAGDVMEWAARYDGPPFHALLCDPPYHLTSITKRFGGNGSAAAQFGKDGAFQRASAGFMGQQWDGGDLAFRPETWAAFMPHLHPGAFGMAFAGSRGWHRLAVAIEDAGYIIHPSIFLLWCYGSGFPKATRIRDNGHEVSGWDGHRYGMQSMKPSAEPVILFQRPYAGRPVDSITATGAGAINVDAGRVTLNGEAAPSGSRSFDAWRAIEQRQDRQEFSGENVTPAAGRWPPNLALSHSPGCTPLSGGGWQCVDGCAVDALGRQSGEREAGAFPAKQENHNASSFSVARGNIAPAREMGDSGTAARFFHNADYLLDRLEDADPFLYTAKAASWEREAGLADADLTTVSDGRAKSIDNPYQRGETKRRCTHPTIKPITLTRWLAALLLPPAEYAPRRLLVPFSGASSEMIGGGLAGWDFVQGIEQSSEYAAIGWARLEWWARYHGWDAEAAMEAASARFAALGNVPDSQLALL